METAQLSQVILASIRKITDNKSSVALLKINDLELAGGIAADLLQTVACQKIAKCIEKPKPLELLNPEIAITIAGHSTQENTSGTMIIEEDANSVALALNCKTQYSEQTKFITLQESKVGTYILNCLFSVYGPQFKLQTTIGKILKLIKIISKQAVKH